MIQSVAYDVPALKKQIQKCHQTQEECDKKVTSNDKKIEEFKQDFEVCVSNNKKIKDKILLTLD